MDSLDSLSLSQQLSLSASPLDDIQCQHKADGCKFWLVGQNYVSLF